MYDTKKITKLQIELTTKCNASCSVCSRNYSGGAVIEGLNNDTLTLSDIKLLFPVEILDNLKRINYCGNLGDAGLVKDLLDILEYFKKMSKHDLMQHVRTNGGMRNSDFWYALGKFFYNTEKVIPNNPLTKAGVVFSVDGLQDTNHIYRRGVTWDKVIANMTAYSHAGGYAIWEWLPFDHNKHQLDEARELATKLGFGFLVKNPLGFYEGNPFIEVFDKTGQHEYNIYPVDYTGSKVTEPSTKKISIHPVLQTPKLSTDTDDWSKTIEIDCESLRNPEDQAIFVTASGHLLPCCYLGAALVERVNSFARHQFKEEVTKISIDKFDLRKNNMVDILQGPYFNNFFIEGWNKESVEEGKLLFCAEMCGKCKQ
jgi:hypothetical protein